MRGDTKWEVGAALGELDVTQDAPLGAILAVLLPFLDRRDARRARSKLLRDEGCPGRMLTTRAAKKLRPRGREGAGEAGSRPYIVSTSSTYVGLVGR
jgi:hypothetical protein